MRILIVEDDAALSSFIKKGLEAEHHAVDAALDGEQGLSMAMGIDYDLTVLDLNLPGVDGLTVLKNLRQRKPNLPVIILTRAQPGGRSCAMPGLRRRRLPGKTVFVSGTIGAGTGAAAAQPLTFGVGAYGARSEPGPSGA